MNSIRYKKHPSWKYTLQFSYTDRISLNYYNIDSVVSPTGYIQLDSTGDLWINQGYSWDGPSGPAFDTATWMRASLIHDALYQLIREGVLDRSFRKQADLNMYRILREDKMFCVRAAYSYVGVRMFGRWAARPNRFQKKNTQLLKAP